MKKYLNVMIDTETLSRRPCGAIIQIAAVPFNLDGSEVKDIDGAALRNSKFVIDINATTCAMYGMDFDMETVKWWTKNVPANEHFKNDSNSACAYSIEASLINFTEWLEDRLKDTGAEELKIWCQGLDFDVPLLREAFRVVFGSEDKLPWKYRNVRDARGYFLEAAEMFAPDVERPYSIIKTDGEKHHAIDDCLWSIAAVQWAYKKYEPAKDIGYKEQKKVLIRE